MKDIKVMSFILLKELEHFLFLTFHLQNISKTDRFPVVQNYFLIQKQERNLHQNDTFLISVTIK